LSILPSVASIPVKLIVTFDVGCDVRTRLKLAVPPASVVPIDVGETLTPAASLSIFIEETVVFKAEVYLLSPEFIEIDIVYAISPSSIKSLTPVAVTVCATFQLAVVKVKVLGKTVPSSGLLELIPIVIDDVG